jgi:hypothetical protein
MIDPLTSLAFSIYSNPGAYALRLSPKSRPREGENKVIKQLFNN